VARGFVVLAIFLMAAPQVHAAPSCQDLFRNESGPALAAISDVELFRLQAAWDRIELDATQGRAAHPSDVSIIMTTAEKMLLSQGATLKRIEFASSPAFEILPAPHGSGWSRMAASLKKNHGARLLFAPAELARSASTALFVYDSRSILISLASLWEGRGNSSVLHEARHAALFSRSHDQPTLFDSFIALHEPGPSDALSPGATEYRTFMDLSELATHAQDLVRIARAIPREDSSSLRDMASQKLMSLRECAANSRSLEKLLETVANELGQAPPVISGPVLRGDRLDPNTAYVRFESGLEVHLRARDSGVTDITILTDHQTAEIAVRSPSLNPSLIATLVANEPGGLRYAQKLLREVFTSWTRDLHGLNLAVQSSLPAESLNTHSAALTELERAFVGPWRAIAPFVRASTPLPTTANGRANQQDVRDGP
jgi:hypothetical protein